MAYKPEIDKNVVYVDGNGTKYKVDSLTNDGVNVIKLKSDGTVDKTIYWPESKWNNKKLSVEGNPPPPPPEDNSFTFQYDESGNLTILKDGRPVKRLNIRGPEGKPGKDGMPGQDGAPGQKGQDGATGQPGKDGAPGEKGQDGAPGKDGAPGPEGKQGAPGPKGEDGVYWYPEISKDGTQLRFKNRNNSSEHTEWYDIKGPKGDTGGEGPRGIVGPAGPVFIPSVNSDGELSWSNTGQGLTNPSTRNIKGDKGDKGDKGATFHPIVKDGVLYWYDDNGNLVKGITPVRITGAQGKQGEQGAQGLSAYQIWLKQGYRGTEQDFLDSLKGEKGTPAPPASFSYKDVKDFKCDVQEIDTNLIIDKNDDTNSPKEIIANRTKEIEDLREKGHSEAFQKKYNVGRFKSFFWWCAGADKDLLTMCPGDHSKYVGIGSVILFTALMAWFSSTIAMRLVLKSPINDFANLETLGAAFFGIVWASMIFFLDRFITNTMYSDGKVTISKEEFFSGLPRITIAIFLGIVISAPLELMIFDQEIDTKLDELCQYEVRKRAVDKKEKLKLLNEELKQLQVQRREIEGNIAENGNIDDLIEKENTTYQKNLSQIKSDNPYPPVPNVSRDDNPKRWEAYEDRREAVEQKRESEKGKEDTRHGNEINRLQTLKSGDIGSNSINDEISKKETEISQLEGDIKADEDSAVATFKKNRNGLGMQLRALHSLAMEGYVPWFYKEKQELINLDSLTSSSGQSHVNSKTNGAGSVYKDSNSVIMSKSQPHNNQLAETEVDQYGAENHKFAAAMDAILHAWWWYLFNSAQGLIMLLFILIDVSPVLYKMMLADGNYDNYLHQEKLLAQDKIRLSLSNMLKKLNDSELKRVAPFIMGDIYEKMAGDSYIYKSEEDFKKEIAAQKGIHWFWRIWPLSMLRWIFWKEEEKPSAPVIILNERKLSDSQKDNFANLDAANTEVFNEVLEMKKKIILASYRRWYKTQHDCIICDDVDDENKGRDPFDDEAPIGDDSEIHMDDNDDPETMDNDSEKEEKDFADENHDEDASKTGNDESKDVNEDSDSESKEENVTEEFDDDEQELPDDDGDDNPKK